MARIRCRGDALGLAWAIAIALVSPATAKALKGAAKVFERDMFWPVSRRSPRRQ